MGYRFRNVYHVTYENDVSIYVTATSIEAAIADAREHHTFCGYAECAVREGEDIVSVRLYYAAKDYNNGHRG